MAADFWTFVIINRLQEKAMMNFYFNFISGEVALDSYFKEWLHDVSTDSEHLHILLPGDEGMKISLNLANNLFDNMCHGRFLKMFHMLRFSSFPFSASRS